MIRRLWIAIPAALLLASISGALTESDAFTNSNLISYDTNFSALKTVSESSFVLPNVNYKFSGESNMEVSLSERGTSNISQSIVFSTPNETRSYSLSSIETHIFCTNVTRLDSNVSGRTSAYSLSTGGSTKIRSTSFGMGIASTEFGMHSLSVTGGHYTEADSRSPSPTNGNSDDFNISFEMYPLELAEPADYIVQDFTLRFGVDGSGLSYYGYDFYRGMEIGDVSSICEMELDKWA